MKRVEILLPDLYLSIILSHFSRFPLLVTGHHLLILLILLPQFILRHGPPSSRNPGHRARKSTSEKEIPPVHPRLPRHRSCPLEHPLLKIPYLSIEFLDRTPVLSGNDGLRQVQRIPHRHIDALPRKRGHQMCAIPNHR